MIGPVDLKYGTDDLFPFVVSWRWGIDAGVADSEELEMWLAETYGPPGNKYYDNPGDRYKQYVIVGEIHFAIEQDAMLFLLRWR